MLTVTSPRGGAAQVDSFLPWTVRDAATAAAKLLGYHPDGVYTLADPDTKAVLRYDDVAPTDGTFELADTGGRV